MRTSPADRHNDHQQLIEALEPRKLLAAAPLPDISDLETPSNTVVRVETILGDIDLELFDQVAPGTVANFLDYVRDGDYDHTIFHRLATGFVLQGGGFRFVDGGGATEIPAEDPIVNEFSRSNIERTIAMAKLGGNPDSATSQWFINLADNSTNLDNQNGGFTVFGRVVNDASWTVVQTFAGLSTRNFGSPFDTLPVTDDFVATPLEENLAFIKDVEIIKPFGQQAFYTEQLHYPEGFSGSTINEFLPIGNPNDSLVFYQVIARAEIDPGDNNVDFDGWFRDRVIFTGTIPARTRGGITISRFTPGTGAPNPDDLLPQGVPYALEIRSTLPLSANLSHFDFGSATGETFTTTTSTTWAFSNARKGDVFEFLVWSNPTSEDTTVDITFFIDGGGEVSTQRFTDAYRRGGLAFNNTVVIPDGSSFGILVESTEPIVVALTQFDNTGGANRGSSALGASQASVAGAIPIANVGTDNDQELRFLNPSNVATIIGLTLTFDDARPDRVIPAALAIPPRSQATFSLDNISGLLDPDRFTVQYNSTGAVYASSLGTARFTVNGDPIVDTIGNPVPVVAATRHLFGEGFIDPGRAGNDVFETVSVFNPNDGTVNVDLILAYTDGFELTLSVAVPAGSRADFDLHEDAQVLAQGTDNNRFFYSLELVADDPVVAQMLHFDLTLGALQPSGGFATIGNPIEGITPLSN